MKIDVTSDQYERCQQYLKGNLTENDLYTLFKTYLRKYIEAFGWVSWQYDSEYRILHNFCGAVVEREDFGV